MWLWPDGPLPLSGPRRVSIDLGYTLLLSTVAATAPVNGAGSRAAHPSDVGRRKGGRA
jgi:hypothetical protein